jgi:FkbM family methyltransferase
MGFEKLTHYARSVAILRSLNVAGLPGIPKGLSAGLPWNRAAYNEFIGWIARLGLNQAKVVVDAGANHGDFAQAASALFPGVRVLLCEPVPSLVKVIESKAAASTQLRWEVEPSALGASEARATLSCSASHDAIASIVGFSEEYLENCPAVEKGEMIDCDVKPLDQVLEERGITAVDLLKIDVEGYEFELLKGAKQALANTRSVVVEVSRLRRPDDIEDPLTRMLELLWEAGLEAVDVIPSLYALKEPWRALEFNILARRPEDAKRTG